MEKTYREIQADRREAEDVYWEERFANAKDDEERHYLALDYGYDA